MSRDLNKKNLNQILKNKAKELKEQEESRLRQKGDLKTKISLTKMKEFIVNEFNFKSYLEFQHVIDQNVEDNRLIRMVDELGDKYASVSPKMNEGIREILEKLNAIYGNREDKSKKPWTQFDLEFKRFSRKFLVGDHEDEYSDYILNDIFFHRDYFEHIADLDSAQKGGWLYKDWVLAKLEKGILQPIRDVDNSSYMSKMIARNDSIDSRSVEVLKIYNIIFLYFLSEIVYDEKVELYFDRDYIYHAYIRNRTPLNQSYSKTHKEFLNEFYYSNYMEDCLRRYNVESYSLPYVFGLRKVLLIDMGLKDPDRYKKIINDYGFNFLPDARKQEIVFLLNKFKRTTFYDEFMSVLKSSNNDSKIYSYDFNEHYEILIEGPIDKTIDLLFGQLFAFDNEDLLIKKLALKIFKKLFIKEFFSKLYLANFVDQNYFKDLAFYITYFLYKKAIAYSAIKNSEKEIQKIVENEKGEDDKNYPLFNLGMYNRLKTYNSLVRDMTLLGQDRINEFSKLASISAKEASLREYEELGQHNRANEQIRLEMDRLRDDILEIVTKIIRRES